MARAAAQAGSRESIPSAKAWLLNARRRRGRFGLTREVEVHHRDVDLLHRQPGHRLYTLANVAPDAIRHAGNADAVVGDQAQIDRRLALPDLNADSQIMAALAGHRAGKAGNGLAQTRTHQIMDAVDLAGGQSGN